MGAKAEQGQRIRDTAARPCTLFLDYRVGKGPVGTPWTHRILAGALRQHGNRVVTNLLFKQGIGQLEALMFLRARVEDHQRTGAKTFELADVMLAKPAPLVQSARVCEHMLPARSINMEVNRLLADWTLCEKRVKSPPSQQLYELDDPYR